MKINISKGIDLNKLHAEIESYSAKTNEYPYLIVNEETIMSIAQDKLCQSADICKQWNSGKIAKYNGYKIFCDDELKFGEVEIR